MNSTILTALCGTLAMIFGLTGHGALWALFGIATILFAGLALSAWD